MVCIDGYLGFGDWGRPRLGLKGRKERDNTESLISLFGEVELDPICIRHELRFTCDDTERFIDWMGELLPGFEYKWAIESRSRYRNLKRKASMEHATQTFDRLSRPDGSDGPASAASRSIHSATEFAPAADRRAIRTSRATTGTRTTAPTTNGDQNART